MYADVEHRTGNPSRSLAATNAVARERSVGRSVLRPTIGARHFDSELVYIPLSHRGCAEDARGGRACAWRGILVSVALIRGILFVPEETRLRGAKGVHEAEQVAGGKTLRSLDDGSQCGVCGRLAGEPLIHLAYVPVSHWG